MSSPSVPSHTADGSHRIRADATLASLAADVDLLLRYPLLADACGRTLGARARTTLADDLAQRGLCPFLERGDPCLKNGGITCPALGGDNRLLSIVDGGPSWIIHPSDAGVALVALDAVLEIAGALGAREVLAAAFFVLPTERLDRETTLRDDERVVAVRLPAGSAGGRQHFSDRRDAERDVALVSLAAVRRTDGEVRLVLGAVSPRPYRVYNSIEEETTTGGLDEDTIEGLAERALLDAEPLSENGYKVEVASRLLRDAIRALSAEER